MRRLLSSLSLFVLVFFTSTIAETQNQEKPLTGISAKGETPRCSDKNRFIDALDVNSKPPNILLLVADDLGYADLGSFGSNIRTPNLDQLASEGIRFTNFYSAPTCAPTRASLLSGTDNHMAGMGSQFIQSGGWGYEGHLSDRIITIPQLLSLYGYHTYMTGKWHLGGTDDQLPSSKGFDRSFILQGGAGNHYNNKFIRPDWPSRYRLDGRLVDWPKGAYSTKVYTDSLISFIRGGLDKGKPFFAYAAYTSPHWPLQVDEAYWQKYKGVYTQGYEELRRQNFEALKEAGIIGQERKLPPLHPNISPWDSLSKEQQLKESRKMELYAGMVENLDHHIGRLIDFLKKTGTYENTLIVFMSDNGAAGEDFYQRPPFRKYLQEYYDNSYENMGTPDSFVSYGKQWAEAGTAPFRFYKGYTYEGGIRVPMIISGPGTLNSGSINKSFATLTDLAPTFYDIAGAEYPPSYEGRDLATLPGKSLLPVLEGKKSEIHTSDEAWVMEHNHHALVRKGRWKLVNPQKSWDKINFELYDLQADPTESINVRDKHPEIFLELFSAWEQYRKDYKLQYFNDND